MTRSTKGHFQIGILSDDNKEWIPISEGLSFDMVQHPPQVIGAFVTHHDNDIVTVYPLASEILVHYTCFLMRKCACASTNQENVDS